MVAVDYSGVAFVWDRRYTNTDGEFLCGQILGEHGKPVQDIVSASCGSGTRRYILLLTKFGTLYEMCDVRNKKFALSMCARANPNIPQKINIAHVYSIKCGHNYVMALSTEGIYTWGACHHQTGFGNSSCQMRLIKHDGEKFFSDDNF